ncbi:hypothetical protein KC343_g10548 [Hortaea werneckii]|nr:hypothetical protein KC352_g8940 [Hortaea werneckii]KAI7569026.1 hypothetical protein KC317_g3673 [Hortaea werneckii]KAI7614323.1 hypothetical protein KC343_g10548 [Hortaea werneckii]KAI7620085.1 hypothetical protein KC346_g4299 [Hortaea werneckii]KAI7681823.1 hypothetical protein KC319_g1357 [Hortaea werneckii]
MFSPVPLINRIDRLKESKNRITLDDIWDYPVRPQRFSMWSAQAPHQHPTPSLRPAVRGSQRLNPSSRLPPLATGTKGPNPPAKPCRISAQHHTRATLPSALRFAETYGSASPPCLLIRRPAQYRRLSPITSRTPRGPQKAGPCDARPSSLKWRIPVHREDGEEEVGVVPSIVVTPPDDKGDEVCPLPSGLDIDGENTAETGARGPGSTTATLGTATGKNEGDARTHHLRRTTTRILGPEKLDVSPFYPARDIHPNYASSRSFDNSSNLVYTAPQAGEDFTLPEDYASTLRLSIIRCPRRKRAWRVVERCLEGVWKRVGW